MHTQETYHLKKHPCIIRITNTSMSILAPPNIHSRQILPIAPQTLQINILNNLPIDHTLIDTILWAIFTHEVRPIPISHVNNHFHMLIKPTTSTC